jgi:uncharacterized membrane protein
MDDLSHSTTPQLSKHRIEALVDGIFAVAMTLLVIDLRLPEHPQLLGPDALRDALFELVPNLYSWLISFIVLAIFWIANHRLYSHVRHVDTPLLWCTILMLGGASLLPFASAVNSKSLSQLAQMVYAAVMITIAAGSLLVATRIYRHPELCAHPMDRATYLGACTRTVGLMLVGVLSVPLAAFFPGYANFAFLLIFALRQLNAILVRRAGPAAVQG